MLDRLTIATCYYRQPAMLAEQIRTIETYPGEIAQRLKLIVVDDGSPEPARIPATLACEVELYRILEDKPWNHVGARNLCLHVAPEGWVMMVDIDHTVPSESMEALFRRELHERMYYLPGKRVKAPNDEPHHPHPDSRVITRAMYWAVGGSNEDLSGIYGAGNEFVARLRRLRFGAGQIMQDVALRVWNLGGEDIGGIPGAGAPLPRKGGEFHWKGKPVLRAKMQQAYLAPPKDPLRFPWTRVL